MELDDLKDAWNSGDNEAKKESLTPDIITSMTERKYYSKMKKIAYSEIGGTLVCLMGIVFMAINLYRLDTPFLRGVGIATILLLLTLCSISLLSLWQLRIAGDVSATYAETLRLFAGKRLRFVQLQKVNITLSYLLLVAVIIISSKIFGGRDITDNKYFWIFSFTIGYIFLLFYSKWVFRFYSNTLKQSETLLQELQS